ncbi:MAG: hypothetical protein WDN49_05130 [Acetobacteraceae bacterium]
MSDAVAVYDDVKERMAQFGRAPEELLIMPGAFPVVAARWLRRRRSSISCKT